MIRSEKENSFCAGEGRGINAHPNPKNKNLGGETSKKGLAVIISAILVISAIAVMPAIASDWQQFQKDDINIGRTDDSAPTDYWNEEVSWSKYTHTNQWMAAGIEGTPIVADGKVFVIDAQGYAWAFHQGNGKEIWNTALHSGTRKFELATPAYADGTVFFATNNDGHVYALYVANGTTKWHNSSLPKIGSYTQLNTPVTYANERIYVGSWNSSGEKNGTYYCLYAANGTLAWNRSSNSGGGYYWAGAAVIGNYLVYGDDGGNLTSVYRCNGTTEDELDTGSGRIRSSIAWNVSAGNANYGHIFFTNRSGNHITRIGFNKSTGEFNSSDRWSHSIGYSTSTPAVYKGRVYVGHNLGFSSGKLYCLDEDDGSEVWNVSVGPVQSSPALSTPNSGVNVYVYFTTNCQNGRVYCVDKNGNEMWHYETNEAGTSGGYILQGVAISDGRVFFGNDGGYLHGINRPAKKNERVHIYNFDSGESEDKWAFKYQNNSRPPDTCDFPNEEFNATEYTNIEADDGSSTFNQTTTANYYAAHRFNISIEEYVANVTEMRVNWKGKGLHGNTSADHNGSYLYIWNGTAYEELNKQTNVPSDTEYSLHGKVTSGISDYVSSTGNVTILVMANKSHAGNNASKLWTNYVELRVHTNVSRYDFRTGASTDKWAFRYQINQTEFDSGSPIYPDTNFTDTQYTNVSKDDSLNVSDVTTGDGNYSAHRFNVTIIEDASDIRKINVTWIGKGDHDSTTDGAYLYIWNFTSTAYEQLDTDTQTPAVEVTLTGEIASGITNYNSSTNNVTILVNQTSAQITDRETDHSHIWTDYVKLELHIGD